ncbi:MAG TPA: MaoC family dehydratase [Alphaproteobacteria bacterium]|nr:MaoC family dehydratase [Alphaproteobacteria bacterium]
MSSPKDGSEKIDYRDVDNLRRYARGEFSAWSREITVTQEMIDDFAELSGDHYWIHTDPELARAESPFGTTVAHGMLVQALSAKLDLEMPVEITGFRNMVNYGSDRLRYPSPVPSGSRIHGRCRIKDVRKAPLGTLLTLEINIHVVGNERPSVTNDILVLYM